MRNDPTGHCPESDEACRVNLASTSPLLQHLVMRVTLVCGQRAGRCDNTEGYDGEPLGPYSQITPGQQTLRRGVDGSSKYDEALAIYEDVKSHPDNPQVLVGHSAGGTAVILAASWLKKDGYGGRIKSIVLLDPYFDGDYPIDRNDRTKTGRIQDLANSLLEGEDKLPVFLGDSRLDEDDHINGLKDGDGEFDFGDLKNKDQKDPGHLGLANSEVVFNAAANYFGWRRGK